MATKLTRRQFLTYLVAGIGATTLTCGGLGAIVSHRPKLIEYKEYSLLSDSKAPIVLVAYGTRAGSTMEIAQVIAVELEKRSFNVDVCPVKELGDLKRYSHVVIGSAIRMSAPLPEVTDFLEKHQSEFSHIPLAFFAVHLQNDGVDEISRKNRSAYLDPIHKLVDIQHEAFFKGVYDPEKVSIIEREMGKSVKTPVGDFRDWATIKNWAQSIFSNDPMLTE